MKKLFAAAALAAALTQPASAITFSSLTTIYVATGVYDSGTEAGTGVATAIQCTNVSGVTVQVRVLVLSHTGSVAGSLTLTISHGRTLRTATHNTAIYSQDVALLTGAVNQGGLSIEATNSAVFCNAVVIDAANFPPEFSQPLHLVRVNPHPGTVE